MPHFIAESPCDLYLVVVDGIAIETGHGRVLRHPAKEDNPAPLANRLDRLFLGSNHRISAYSHIHPKSTGKLPHPCGDIRCACIDKKVRLELFYPLLAAHTPRHNNLRSAVGPGNLNKQTSDRSITNNQNRVAQAYMGILHRGDYRRSWFRQTGSIQTYPLRNGMNKAALQH